MNIIFTDGTKENFSALVENIVIQAMERKEAKSLVSDEVHTINQVANRLKMAHATIKKLVKTGQLKATADGKITEKALNEYLGNN